MQDERWAHAGDHVLFKFGPGGQVVERYRYGPQTDHLLAVTRDPPEPPSR